MMFFKVASITLIFIYSVKADDDDKDHDDDDNKSWKSPHYAQTYSNVKQTGSSAQDQDMEHSLPYNQAQNNPKLLYNNNNKNAYYKYMNPPPPPPPERDAWRGPRDPEYEDYYENKMKEYKHRSNLGIGLGIGLGVGIPVLIILIGLGYLYYRYRKNRAQGSALSSISSVIFNPYHPQMDSKTQSPCDNADLWAMDRQNVIIDFEDKLGSGAFCNVHKAKIKGAAPVRLVCPNLIAVQKFTNCEVAVKLLPPFADDIARSDFTQEINFMKSLHYHPHLVSMLGYVSDVRNPLLLVEYCAKGDLLHFIRNHRTEIEHGYENNQGIKIKNLVSFAWQISNGLEYLNSVGCIHRDVACRNVLLDADNICKIADFGLCRLTDNLLYTARGGRLPIRWMAIESLKSFEYSFKTDVWSYGILLYELTSLGEVPYAQLDNQQLLDFLESGQRLARPIHCPPEIYAIMKDCWQSNPSLRPSFDDICEKLRAILEAAAPDYGYVVPVPDTDSLTAFRYDDV